MKEKIGNWFADNRIKVGYFLGGLNIAGGISLLPLGQYTNGAIQIFVGCVLVIDAWIQNEY